MVPSVAATKYTAKRECVNVAPVDFPAFCPNCGLIFGSSFAFEHVQGLTLSGVRQSCPRCGAAAELPDGTFDVGDDTIHVLSASELTQDRLLRLSEILEAVQEGRISDDDAAQAVSEAAPSISPLIERLRPKMGRAFLMFLYLVVQILLAQAVAEHRDDSATKQDVQRAVERAVEQCQMPPPPP